MGRAVNMSLRGFQNGSQFEDVGWNGNSRGCLEDDGSSGLCLELPRGEDDNERQRVFYGANPRLLTLVLASILLLLRTTIPLFSNPMCINIEWRENVIISIVVVSRKHFREIEWRLFLQRNLLLSTVVVIMSFDIVFLRLDYIASISSHIITLT